MPFKSVFAGFEGSDSRHLAQMCIGKGAGTPLHTHGRSQHDLNPAVCATDTSAHHELLLHREYIAKIFHSWVFFLSAKRTKKHKFYK